MARVKPVVLDKSLLDLLPGFQVTSWDRRFPDDCKIAKAYLACEMSHPDGRRIICSTFGNGWIATLWNRSVYVGGADGLEQYLVAESLCVEFFYWIQSAS